MTRALESLKNFHFNGLLLSKLYIVLAKKVQRISLNWRGIQNLERKGLLVSKLTEEIWHIWTWALRSLKNFHFNGLSLSTVYIVWAQKVERSNLSWNWKRNKNLERNRLLVSKLAKGIRQILTWALERPKDFHFKGLLMSKVYIVLAKKV